VLFLTALRLSHWIETGAFTMIAIQPPPALGAVPIGLTLVPHLAGERR